jgi:hypothetical protein
VSASTVGTATLGFPGFDRGGDGGERLFVALRTALLAVRERFERRRVRLRQLRRLEQIYR